MAEKKNEESETTDEVTGRVGKHMCQPCSRNDRQHVADVFCKDCVEYQCNECARGHKIYPVMFKHKLVSVNEAADFQPKYDMKGLDQCQQHEKLIEFFCEDEEQLCCSTCAIVKHRKCKSVVEIKEKANTTNTTGNLRDLSNELHDISVKANKVVQRINDIKQSMLMGTSAIMDDVHKKQQDVYKLFEDLKHTLKEEIGEFQTHVIESLQRNEACSKRFIEDTEKFQVDIQNILQSGTNPEQFIIAHLLKEPINVLKSESKKENDFIENIVIDMGYEFSDAIQSLATKNAIPGKLTLKSTNDRPKDGDHKSNPHLKVTLVASINGIETLGDKTLKENSIIGMDILPDGRLVSVDFANRMCFVFNNSMKQVGSHELLFLPLDVVVLSDKKFAITSAGGENSVHFYEISESNNIILTQTRFVGKQYVSIGLIGDDRFLVGACDVINPVQIVSFKSDRKSNIVTVPTCKRRYSLWEISCAYIIKHDKVVVTDTKADTVYIFDIKTNLKIKVRDEKLIAEPSGVASGIDCVFVCSEKTNSIVQISHTGEILSSHKLDITFPRRITLSKDNKRIAVSGASSGCIKLYDISTA